MVRMRLLKLSFNHIELFKYENMVLDFFASDRVADERGVTPLEGPICSQNLLAFAGINATGKTTSLQLLQGALALLMGRPISEKLESLLATLAPDIATMNCIFYHAGMFYGLSSTLSPTSLSESSWPETWKFVDEKLWSLSRISTKKTLESFEAFIASAKFAHSRNELSKDLLDYLPSNVSMVTAVTKTSEQFLSSSVYSDIFWLKLSDKAVDTTVLQVFDGSIDNCDHDDRLDCYALTFKNSLNTTYLGDTDILDGMLSDGTVKGANLVQQAILALRTGGYLLIDEIENHLNKQLVGVILDLFESNETNPKGALLVFSTHYPEILDFIKRKDNVYFFTRDAEHHVEVTKYSNVVKRIENKKSEVFLSNYIKGTAPRYSAVSSLKSHIVQLVSGGQE